MKVCFTPALEAVRVFGQVEVGVAAASDEVACVELEGHDGGVGEADDFVEADDIAVLAGFNFVVVIGEAHASVADEAPMLLKRSALQRKSSRPMFSKGLPTDLPEALGLMDGTAASM